MGGKGDLQDELEALRRELRELPLMADDGDAAASAAPSPAGDMRGEIELVLRDLQERLEKAADDAEEIVAAHPFASVAVAFLLGVLVANFMSRER
jgi:ElaB/YqjD/DUF883 family membrane-anchored ribosome-binding protein